MQRHIRVHVHDTPSLLAAEEPATAATAEANKQLWRDKVRLLTSSTAWAREPEPEPEHDIR